MSPPEGGARVVLASRHVIAHVAARLRAGEVVALPTETVYGLAADALNDAAVRRIFALKARPASNPLIVHVLDAARAKSLTSQWDERCDALAAKFWPGPLTLVLPKVASVPDAVTAGHSTVALRAPAHPVMREVLAAFDGPLAAPSANRSSSISPTTAAHVASEFADVDSLLILDGGACEVGIESTVLDMISSVPRVLRPGAVSIEMLRDLLGEVESATSTKQSHSPGTSPRHYAPRTPSELLDHKTLRARIANTTEPLAVICFDVDLATAAANVIVLPSAPDRCAAALYDALRHADGAGAKRILIERPAQSTGLWAAILDRLIRATTPL